MTPSVAWHQNDDLLREQVTVGHRWAEKVAGRIGRLTGLEVAVTPLEVRETLADRHRFADEWDLTVAGRIRLEVKSRGIAFTGPEDFPYREAFVYAADGWERKTHYPAAIVLVSQKTEGIAVVPRASADAWLRETVHDRTDRDVVYDVLTVGREYLRTFESLCEWLVSECAA